MSEVELTPEEIERRKEEQREYIRGQIRALQLKISRLEHYKEQLGELHGDIGRDVYRPESTYDLTVSSDIAHWAGNLEVKAAGYQHDTASGISSFMSDIMSVMGTINDVIGKINGEIGGLQQALNSI